jgi:hypothetical protein
MLGENRNLDKINLVNLNPTSAADAKRGAGPGTSGAMEKALQAFEFA